MSTGVQVGEHGFWWGAEGGHLWAEDGRTALPSAATVEDAEASLARFDGGEFYCSGCQDWHPKPHAFRRFAGLYCEAAAEKHKAANSRICILCRRPLWDCYC